MVSVLDKLGVIYICLLAIHVGRLLNDYWRKWCVIQYYKKIKLKDLGNWGVVVGADENVGRSYAVELAKEGLNLVLVGTDLPKLRNLSNFLEKYFQVFSGIITLTYTANEFHHLQKALNSLDIAILINVPDFKEVVQPEIPQKVEKMDRAVTSAINRNLVVLTKMCAMLMPGMISRGKGIIINPTFKKPKGSPSFLDKACTAYVEKLSEELRNKYSSTGVLVQTFFPSRVLSERPSKRMKRLIALSEVASPSDTSIRTKFQRSILNSLPFSLFYRNQASYKAHGILASVMSVIFTTP